MIINKKTLNLFTVWGPLIALILLFAFFSIKVGENFYSLYNIKTILAHSVIVGIAALGMTFVIISGGIDLSVGSQLALGIVVTAVCLEKFGGKEAEYIGISSSILAALIGIAACGICGLINGAVSTSLKIVPFIVTLGMMQIARGTAKWLGNQQAVYPADNSLCQLMNIETSPSWYSIAPGVWILIVLLIIAIVVLKFTVFGRHVYAIGSNEQTAKLCGINVTVKRIIIYTICGIFTGIAAVMLFASLGMGSPTSSIGTELDIIAAVVIGGGSLLGGKGSAIGTIIGALIMVTLKSGCNMMEVETFVHEILTGCIIIAAAAIDVLKGRFGELLTKIKPRTQTTT